MSLVLLELDSEGQAIAWEADEEGILNEAIGIIRERLEGLPKAVFMSKLCAILDQTSTVYNYGFQIMEGQ